MSEPVVVDASAVVSLLIDSGDAGAAVATALADREWHAPDLLPYEVGNVLRRRNLRGLLSDAQATTAHAALTRLPFELWSYTLLSDRVWALRGSITAYDAAYVALAERLQSVLVTSDARLTTAPGPTCEFLLVDR